jgi:hypothetical protein
VSKWYIALHSIPDIVTDFFSSFIYLIHPTALWAWGLAQSLTETSTRNLLGVKARRARKADNFAAMNEPIV